MIHLGVRSIPTVPSWFQTQTAGTHTSTGTHWWYIGMLPLKLKVYPWPASSRAETPTLRQRDALKEDAPRPKRWPVQKRCLVWFPGKMHHKRRTTKGMRKNKTTPRNARYLVTNESPFSFGNRRKKSVTKRCNHLMLRATPLHPKVAAYCVGGPPPPKKNMLEPKYWVQKTG